MTWLPAFAIDSYGLLGVATPITAHPATVAFSLLIACMASFVAFNLAGRVRTIDVVSSRLWVLAGAIVLGTGIWAMHFIGMAAGRFPFSARVNAATTLFSWLLAITAAFAPVLLVSSAAKKTSLWSWAGALASSIGVAVMHLVGMGAMETFPAPTLHAGPLAVAAVVATLLTRAASLLVSSARHALLRQALTAQIGAALLSGAGLTALHYLAMAGASYEAGTICAISDGLEISALGGTVGVVALAFLSLMMLVSWLERRSYRLAMQLNSSLDQTQEELRHVTFTDAVTGLPNRLVFQDRLNQAVDAQSRSGGKVAVILLEPDQFVEQTHHLDATDQSRLMQDVAGRLDEATGSAWTVTSAGGHQFLLLCAGPDVDADLAVSAFQDVVHAFDTPFAVRTSALLLRASAGITLFPNDGPADRLTSNAGSALELVRSRGAGSFAFFEADMDADARDRAIQLAALRQAIASNQLELHYQPKVHASTGLIAGAEALVRWHHPQLGCISPGVFVPLAERFGLIEELGDWVLEQACRQMAVWRSEGLRMRVAVNVSMAQLAKPDFAERVVELITRYRVDAGQLTCEVTESGAMKDIAGTLKVFDDLSRSGVRLSIDDFGTGYSSLSYLRRLPISQLKIDRSFVSDLDHDTDARAVVGSIIQLAKALRLEVVAEGVETAAQRDILLDLDCDKFQGFFFARPMPAADLSRMSIARPEEPRFRESIFAAA